MKRRVLRLPVICTVLLVVGAIGCSGPSRNINQLDGSIDSSDGNDQTDSIKEQPLFTCDNKSAAAKPFHKITDDVEHSSLSVCGYLQYLDEKRTLHLLDPELSSANAIAEQASGARFSPSGDVLMYASTQGGISHVGAYQLASDSAKTTTINAEKPGISFDAVRSSTTQTQLYVCDDDGLRVFNQDFSAVKFQEKSAFCPSITTTAFGENLVFADADHHLHGLDLATYQKRKLSSLTYRATWESYRSDQLALSRDGQVLLHYSRNEEPCGDSFCFANSALTIVDATYGNTIGTLADVPEFKWVQTAGRDHSMLFSDGNKQVWFLNTALDLKKINAIEPLHLFENKTRGLFRRMVGNDNFSHVIDIQLDSATDRQDLGSFDDGFVSRDETVIATGHFVPERCIHYPDRPDTCHKQIWAVSLWRGTQKQQLAESTQPLIPLWVGNDGRSLVSGAIAESPLPNSAKREDVPTETGGLHLLAPDGTRLAMLKSGDYRGIRVWETPETLLVKLGGMFDGHFRERVYALNLKTGSSTILVEGDRISVELDQSRTRIACHVEDDRSATPIKKSLWAGAVPVPQ